MKRLTLLALMLSFVFATPVAAQPKADMSPQTTRYGPPAAPVEIARSPQRRRSYALGETTALPSTPDDHRMIAAEQVGLDAKFGIGLFRVITPDHPQAVNREPIVQSRIAAVGLAVKFKR